MSGIAVWFSRVMLSVAATALAFVSSSPQPAYALSPSDASTPPAPRGERLERVWAREQQVYERLGRFFDNADQRTARAQQLIDRLAANGKDVSTLQAALEAFEGAVKQAHPAYEGGKGLIASHQGFDDSGQVTDLVKAAGTVRDMGSRLREVRQTVKPALIALRDAVREFHQANRPSPEPTASH